jgi:hypothetical protein
VTTSKICFTVLATLAALSPSVASAGTHSRSAPLELVGFDQPVGSDDLSSVARGDSLEVEWHGSWYPAEVIETRAGLTKIHFSGYGSEWDEWVEPQRLRQPAIATKIVATSSLKTGERVQVEWGGTWWEAEVLGQKSESIEIRYLGYGDEWNEWVPPKRIRHSR